MPLISESGKKQRPNRVSRWIQSGGVSQCDPEGGVAMEPEWQPARVRNFHEAIADPDISGFPEIFRKVIRIRPFTGIVAIQDFRNMGCDAEKFYEVHPKDRGRNMGQLVCEHEILTD